MIISLLTYFLPIITIIVISLDYLKFTRKKRIFKLLNDPKYYKLENKEEKLKEAKKFINIRKPRIFKHEKNKQAFAGES